MVVGAVMIVVSLSIGMIGYHFLGGLTYRCVYDVSISRDGSLSSLYIPRAKLFAGCYAIYCGLALIAPPAGCLRFAHEVIEIARGRTPKGI